MVTGWKQAAKNAFTVTLSTQGRGIYRVVVLPLSLTAKTAVAANTDGFVKGAKVSGPQKGKPTALTPPNSNIATYARINFVGRIRSGGSNVAIVGHCIAMTGVEAIHRTVATACLVAPRRTMTSSNRDAAAMAASVARHI